MKNHHTLSGKNIQHYWGALGQEIGQKRQGAHFLKVLHCKSFRASGETILGTLKYFCEAARAPARMVEQKLALQDRHLPETASDIFNAFYDVKIFRASGEAILGTLKYFCQAARPPAWHVAEELPL